jgi:hypothetical protein
MPPLTFALATDLIGISRTRAMHGDVPFPRSRREKTRRKPYNFTGAWLTAKANTYGLRGF